MNRPSRLAVLLGLLIALAPAAARAGDDPSSDAPTAPEPRSVRPGTIGLEGGPRVSIVPNAGLDPYASTDFVPQLSLAGTITALRAGSLSLGARAGWDFGGTSTLTRGEPTSLLLHRVTVGAEARYAVTPWFHLVADVTPGLLHLRGKIEDAGFDLPMVARSWTWALDASGGLAFRMAHWGRREAPGGLWFSMAAGYGFAGEAKMVYSPDAEAGETRKFGPTTLPDLRLAGAMNRFALALMF